MMLQHKVNKYKNLSIEARGNAVIDTACASTVAGKIWMDDYINNHLTKKEQNKIVRKTGRRTFRFGAGPTLKSTEELAIPATIAGKEVYIVTDVVDSDVPLLLSMRSLEKADGKIFTKQKALSLYGRTIKCEVTSTGHWLVPLKEEIEIKEVCAVDLGNLEEEDLKKNLLKLHAQFGHPAKQKLVYLLKNANMWESTFDKVLENIQNNCRICKQFTRTPARPVVAMPMAKSFNDTVCMDLKKWRGRWILHMIDMYSRYTQSVWVPRKYSREILDAILENWCGVFGVMNTILTDNGGEFTSEEIRETTSFLNIKKYTTAAEAPWQNGLCERVHAITDQILSKLAEEYPHVRLQTLLKWANMAKNSLQMNNGFTPHQLVFGENPNLPNIMNAKIPALEETTTSETFGKHLNLMQFARQKYIEVENSERIKRALRHKIRTRQEIFQPGMEVYYKREGEERWLGPGKVMFQDGKIVFVRHGSVYVKVSVNRLITTEEDRDNKVNNNKEENIKISENCNKEEGDDQIISSEEKLDVQEEYSQQNTERK